MLCLFRPSGDSRVRIFRAEIPLILRLLVLAFLAGGCGRLSPTDDETFHAPDEADGADDAGGAESDPDTTDGGDGDGDGDGNTQPEACTGCEIGDVCIASGQADPSNPCQACDPTRSKRAWSSREDGASCSDGTFCNGEELCTAGMCGSAGTACASDVSCSEELGQCCLEQANASCDGDDVVLRDTCGTILSTVKTCERPQETCVSADAAPGDCGCAPGWFGATCNECRLYVSAERGDDAHGGGSWEEPLATLTLALLKVGSWKESVPDTDCEIWLEEGTYYPSADGDVDASFELVEGLSLYGGFAGSEQSAAERELTQHVTVLSGDIDGNGELDDGNSRRVVVGADRTLLDGFTIVQAVDEQAEPWGGTGGSLVANNVEMTLRSCTFAENGAVSIRYQEGSLVLEKVDFLANAMVTVQRADFTGEDVRFIDSGDVPYTETGFYQNLGTLNATRWEVSGLIQFFLQEVEAAEFSESSFHDLNVGTVGWAHGLAAEDTPLTIRDSVFSGNVNSLYLTDGVDLKIYDSSFLNNHGLHATVYTHAFSSLLVERTQFIGNIADNTDYGGAAIGGAHGPNIGPVAVRDSLFAENSTPTGFGGAIQLYTNDEVLIQDSVFVGNSAYTCGGFTLYSYDRAQELSGVLIANNHAQDLGGGACLSNGVIENTVFSGNTSDQAAALLGGADTQITSSTFADNVPGTGGGIVEVDTSDSTGSQLVTISNSLIWNHDTPADPVFSGDLTNFTVTYSDVQGGWPGAGNIDVDPLFTDPDNGDYSLSSSSLCIDAGSDASLPADLLDLDGDLDTSEALPVDHNGAPRVQGAAVDMGAFESSE